MKYTLCCVCTACVFFMEYSEHLKWLMKFWDYHGLQGTNLLDNCILGKKTATLVKMKSMFTLYSESACQRQPVQV